MHSYNLGTTFDSILSDIKEQINEINCIYFGNEINLLHDYSENINEWNDEEDKKLYLEAKELNRKLSEEEIELYINNKKYRFDNKYINKESKELKVKFMFNQKLTNISFMFYKCEALKSIDLSLFNTNNVKNMSSMFFNCTSLISINLSSINTSNIKDMSKKFSGCSSLSSIDLSSFKTKNVNILFQYSFHLHFDGTY